MSQLAIETNDLHRSFDETEAVNGVNLAIAEGEIYGFLGPNGAGKSTTVRMLCTLLLPTAGTARVAGFDVRSQADDVRLRIGVALQDAALDDMQTGRELLRLQARLYGLSNSEIDARIRDVSQFIDVEAIDRRIGTYSGGMKRRLDLAAALMHNPEVLFLDEPTTGLDPTSRLAVWDEVRKLNEGLGITVFLTTQYLEEADELADRVGIIAHGSIVAEGTPAALKAGIGSDVIVVDAGDDRVKIPEVLAGLSGVTSVDISGHEALVSVADGAESISPVALALAHAGISVHALTLRTPTLDDVFLAVTGGRMDESDDDVADAGTTPKPAHNPTTSNSTAQGSHR